MYLWYNKGEALAGLKHYDEACACCERARGLEPENSRAQTMMDMVLGMIAEEGLSDSNRDV